VEISELVVALSTVTAGWDGGMSLIQFCFEVYEDSDGHVSSNDLAKVSKHGGGIALLGDSTTMTHLINKRCGSVVSVCFRVNNPHFALDL
jgi:hypothetical protein